MKSLDEKQLIDQAIQGNTQGFNLMADHYYADCFQKALAIVHDQALAQDIPQISLLQAYHSLSKLKDPSRFKYWLLGIVKNISRNYLKQKKRCTLSLEELQHTLRESQDEAAARRINALILSAVYALEKHYSDIILAFYYDAKSLQDVAQREQLSLSATKVRLHRARMILKEKLAVYDELFYYAQKFIQKKMMKLLTIADIYLKENGSATVLLQTEACDYFLPIIIGFPEAESIVMGMQNLTFSRPRTQDLAAAIISSSGINLKNICINKLEQGVFYAYLTVQNGKKEIEVHARPSDAIASVYKPLFL